MTAVEVAVVLEVYTLDQNYPNPFNPLTTITFGLPEVCHMNLAVYDLLGRRVAELINGIREAGMHTITFDASNFASGLYSYRIEVGNFISVKKMMLVK